MSPTFHRIVATALLVLGGCATVPSPSTPVVEGFRPDGGGGPTTEQVEALSRGEGDGIILRFASGDEVVLDLRLDGDVLRSGEDSELSFIVDRPIEAWMGPEGVRFRIEGGPWRAPLEFFTGSLSTSISLGEEDRVNRAVIAIEANRR